MEYADGSTEPMQCPICMEIQPAALMRAPSSGCSHLMCLECLNSMLWKASQRSDYGYCAPVCPFCRRPFELDQLEGLGASGVAVEAVKQSLEILPPPDRIIGDYYFGNYPAAPDDYPWAPGDRHDEIVD